MERFVEVRRRGLKVNAGKTKVMVLNGEERLECEVHEGGIRLKHVSELNIWSVFWTNQVHMGQSGRRVAGSIKSLVNARGLNPHRQP